MMTSLIKDQVEMLMSSKHINYVYFDVFDTIIARNVHPEYVKKLFAKRLILRYRLNQTAESLYQLRSKIELELCEESKLRGNDLEFQYDEMALRLYDTLIKNNFQAINDVPRKDFVLVCNDIEFSVELSVQTVDSESLDILKRLKNKSVSVGCISDIYLSRNVVERLFKHHGISDYIERIYLSSESCLTKRSGRLYDLVLNENSLNASNVIMIGDNDHSDFRMARSKGINAVLLERDHQKAKYKQHWDYVHDNNMIHNKIKSVLTDSPYKCMGSSFAELSLTLFLFVKKLYERFVYADVKDVFFLSREGEFLVKLFNIYQEHQQFSPQHKVKSHYLIVSRRSTYLPSLDDIANESFGKLFRQYRKISLYEFLSSINFDAECIKRVANELNVDPNFVEDDFPTSNLYLTLRNNNTFKTTFEMLRMQQRENLIRYIESFGADIQEKGLYLVDIGWKGSIQDNLFNVFSRELRIHGLYLGYIDLFGSNGTNEGSTKEGVLFSMAPDKTKYYNAYADNTALFEVILGASHGSAVSYVADGNSIKAITHEEPGEKTIYLDKVCHIQTNIEQKFRLLCAIDATLHHDSAYLERFAAKTHSRLVFFPTQAEIDYFRGLYHYENFGYFRVSRFDEICDNNTFKNLFRLILNPNKTLNRGWWIPLTLSSLGLGFLRYPYGVCRHIQNFWIGNR